MPAARLPVCEFLDVMLSEADDFRSHPGWWRPEAHPAGLHADQPVRSRADSAATQGRRGPGAATKRVGLAWLILGGLLVSCAPPASTPQAPGQGPQAAPAAKKRAVAAIAGQPFSLSYAISSGGAFTPPGSEALEEIVHSGLTVEDNQGAQIPRLAEAVPSVENGLWKVFPDGRMETTWRIKPNAQWHDGVAFTSEDLVFTMQVVKDPEVTVFRNRAFDLIDGVRASDRQTVVVSWRKPFIDAQRLFSSVGLLAMPQPKHILEPAYRTNKSEFDSLPFWTDEFVGTGPFKLNSWQRDQYMVVTANDQYVMGRPKLDELEVRFIPDIKTVVANALAEAVDFTLGRGLSLEFALQAGDQWKEGHVESAPYSWIQLWPQLVDPKPALMTDPQFRRAVTYATDRQQLVDAFMHGQGGVAQSYMRPTDEGFAEIDASSVVKYSYDPPRAVQLIQELGYSRGSDGIFVDRAGQKLNVQVKANAGDDLREKLLPVIADQWQRAGVEVEQFLVPTQRQRDFEFISTFPGWWMTQRPNGLGRMDNLYAEQSPLPANGYTGANISRWQNADFDALLDRYFQSPAAAQRIDAAKQLIRWMTDQVIIMGLFYTVEAILVNNHIGNVHPRAPDGTHAWNAAQWDVTN